MATIKQVKKKKGFAFQVDIRIKGYKRLIKTFTHHDFKTAKKLAQKWASDIELQMQKGTYKEIPSGIENLDTDFKTVAQLILYYKNNVAPQKYSYAEKYHVMYDWWISKIGTVKIRDLSAPMLSSCKQILATEKIKRKDKEVTRGNNTINKYLMF